MIGALLSLLGLELKLAWRRSADSALTLGFFLIGASLFPLATDPRPEILGMIAGGIIWVLALLSVMIGLDRFFAQDQEDGFLVPLALSPYPLSLVMFVKALSHWIITGVPLILLSPVLGLLLHLPADAFAPLMIGLLLGTPGLSFVGMAGAALTIGARRAGLLAGLIVLPFYIPFLIFGISGLLAALDGGPTAPHFLIEAGLLIGAIALTPLVGAASLRHFLSHS